ncbi:MAG: hypothetical protein IJM39_02685 [Firmicutes bacterium]|nr:hypothetical protein [Bacillota bacterium]
MNKDLMVADFMKSFINNNTEAIIDKEYFELEKEYKSLFKHPVPKEMLPDSITDDVIKTAMKKCIETKKDLLFDLLGVKINKEFLY